MNARTVDHDPRAAIAATASLTIAILAHVWASITGLVTSYWISSIDWVVLASSEFILLMVVLRRPDDFRLRRFRLPGVMVTSISLVLLAPLPGVIRAYGDQVPRQSVSAIAAGVLATALVFALAPQSTPARRARVQRSSEQGFPLLVVAIAIVVFPIWLRSLSSIPLLDLLGGGRSGVEIAQARDAAFLDLPSLPLRITVAVVRNLYLLFAIAWLVSDWIVTPRAEWRARSRRRIVASAAVAVAAAYAIVTTERAILGEVAIVVVIAALVASRKALSARLILVVTPIVLAFPLVFGVLASGGSTPERLDASVQAVQRRVFFLPADVMVHYFTLVPERLGYLHGGSVPKIPRLFGADTVDLSSIVYDTYYRVDESLNGIANGSYLGVGWANFGPLGVVLWSVAAATAVVVLEHLIRRLPTRTASALRAVAVIQVGFLTSVDVFRSVLGVAPGIFDLILLALALEWLDRRRTYVSAPTAGDSVDSFAARPS